MAADVVTFWTSGEDAAAIEVIVETTVDGEGKTSTYNLPAGDMSVVCLGDLAGDPPAAFVADAGFRVS